MKIKKDIYKYTSGNIECETYRYGGDKGIFHLYWRNFFEDGTICIDLQYNKGIEVGVTKHYFKHEYRNYMFTQKNDDLHGIFIEFDYAK